MISQCPGVHRTGSTPDSLNSVKVSGVTGENYYTHESMGSVANLTDSAGTAQRSYTYEPYGNTRKTMNLSGAPTNLMRFDSQYFDISTGLFDNRARMYDPGTGGFLQSDPTGQSPSYAFAADRPTVMGDPSGLFPWGKIAAVITVAALAVGAGLCLAATEGICAGVTLFGVGATGVGAGTVCEADQSQCQQIGQDVLSVGEGVLPAAEEGATRLDASELSMTSTVEQHIGEYAKGGALARPYADSVITIQNIMDTATPMPDPGGVLGALRWDVPGAVNGSSGTWQLVVDPVTKTILHYMFKGVG